MRVVLIPWLAIIILLQHAVILVVPIPAALIRMHVILIRPQVVTTVRAYFSMHAGNVEVTVFLVVLL